MAFPAPVPSLTSHELRAMFGALRPGPQGLPLQFYARMLGCPSCSIHCELYLVCSRPVAFRESEFRLEAAEPRMFRIR